MRIHEDIESILLCYSEQRDCVLYPFVVIFARSRMLNRFPREDISDGGVAPSSQPRKMGVRIIDGEGTANEGDAVAVEEVLSDVRGLIGYGRKFGVARDVYSMEDDFSILSVAKPLTVDAESKGSHGTKGTLEPQTRCAALFKI